MISGVHVRSVNVSRMAAALLRLLPRALYRYARPAADIIDGAVFAFVSTGTNPNAFLAIEARRDTDGKLVWYYGVARLGIAAVAVRLDDIGVWKAAHPLRRVVKSGRPVLDGTYATSPYLKRP